MKIASDAAKTTDIASIKEQIRLDILDKQFNTDGGSITDRDLKTVLEKYGTINYEDDGTTIKGITTKDKGYEILLKDIWNGSTVAGGTENPPETPQYIGGQYNDDKKVNTPKLTGKLIPVTIDSSNGNPIPVENPNTDSTWYSYTETDKKWANAITTEDGTKTGKITGYWVWIPRYAYQIESQYNTGGIGGGTINIKFLKGKTNDASDGQNTWDNDTGLKKWNVHPAFVKDTSKGGWNDNLEGIWVAKFPAGFASR